MRMSADVRPIFEAMGTIDGLVTAMESDAYADILLNTAIVELKEKFDVVFKAASLSNPEKYHHVWEWGGIGSVPLYYLIKAGKGKRKTVSFSFRQSLKAVPKPDPDKTGIPQENIDRLKRRSIFRFKALVMETGTYVHINPRRAKVLFIPTPGAEDRNGNQVNFTFAKSATINNVGGEAATGAFSTFWTMFWASEAPAYMDEVVKPRVEKMVNNVANKQFESIRRGSASKVKTVIVQPVSALNAAHEARKEMASKDLTTYAQSFERDDEEIEDDEV